MATPSLRIQIRNDGSLEFENPVIQPPKKQYWRIPHDIERYDWNKPNYDYITSTTFKGVVRNPVTSRNKALPEVYRLDPDHHVVLRHQHQWLWKGINPNLSGAKWSSLLGNQLAWTNWTGFPGHYNAVLDVEADKPMPRFDQARVCGGAILAGTEVKGIVYFDSIISTDPLPSVEELLASPWLWYWGTSINPRGEINKITRLGIDGRYYPVRIPIITAMQVFLPASQLHKLPDGFWPDATWTHYI